MPTLRTPPTAAVFALHLGRPKGHCRWCGKAIERDGILLTRSKWHDECVTEYKLLAWPAETRKAVAKRDRGICCDCGTDCLTGLKSDFVGCEHEIRMGWIVDTSWFDDEFDKIRLAFTPPHGEGK